MDKLYFKFTFNRIYSKGYLYIIKKICKYVLMFLCCIIFFPVSLILHFLKFRVVNIFSERIGHLVIESACLLIDDNAKQFKFIILRKKNILNDYFFSLLNFYFILINNRVLVWLLDSMTLFKFILLFDCNKYERELLFPKLSFGLLGNKSNLDSIINVPNYDIIYLDNYLRSIGLSDNDWYVCIHSREEGFSIVDDYIQSHRNSDIHNYKSAINYVSSLGGWIIRLGDSSMNDIKFNNNKLVDYALSNSKNQMLDVLLCKSAKFILGSTSGICTLGCVLGTPCAITNLMPTGHGWYTKFDFFITKKIFSLHLNRFLSLFEMMSLPVSNFRYKFQYDESGYICIENTPEEILCLTIDMINFLNNNYQISDDQKNINNLISSYRVINSNASYSNANFSLSFYCNLI